MDEWLETLAEVAQHQPQLVSKPARLRIAVGTRGSTGGKAWSIVCDPTQRRTPVLVRTLSVDEQHNDASYDCQLFYEDEEVWRTIQSGVVDPRTAMKENKMSMKGSFRTIMGMRKLFAAASAAATGGSYKVTVQPAGVSATRPAASGRRRPSSGASCCAAPGRAAPEEFLVRVVRHSDNAVGEGIRTATEYMQLPAASFVGTKAPVISAAAIERDLTRLLMQASLPDADPAYAAVWSFVRLPAPETIVSDQASEADRVAAAEAEAAQLRERLAEVESLIQRRETPLYSAAATFGMGWVIVPLALMAYHAAAAHALALRDGRISVFPNPRGFLVLLLTAAALRLHKRPKLCAASVLVLLLLVKVQSWFGLLLEHDEGSAAAGMEEDSGTLLGWATGFLLSVLTSLGGAVSWLVAWSCPAVLVCAFGLSVAYWRLPRESPRRRRGAMYAMFWCCALRYLLCWLRAKGFDEQSEFSRVSSMIWSWMLSFDAQLKHSSVWSLLLPFVHVGAVACQALYANTHAAIAEDMYMTMSQLRGFWVKLGQYISTRADMVRMSVLAASFS